jgi:putative secretion ATPase (PEP-CTERM system associated)
MYDEFYRLTGKPFQLTPDQRFFFDSQVHHRAMAYLRYGLEQGEGFIVITGGIGTGKTMLVRALFSELENRNIMAAQLVTTQVGPEDMLRMVCASFGLAHEGMNKATMLHNLEVIARTRFAEGKRILLVVDEAQNLPAASIEELRMLANFQVQGRSLFQSFLLGQDELRRTLQGAGMEQLRQRIIASYHLEPLSSEETRGYVEYRLKLVGWDSDPNMDDALFEGIYAFTDGVPRRINALCDRLLLYGCIEEKHALGADDLEVVQTEMNREVGHAQHPAEDDDPMPAIAVQDSGAGPPESGADIDHEQNQALSQRLARLEAEVRGLREVVKQERKLLRKAVLLQLGLEAYDELD